jgi:signal transduction histidine kinase/FixJ family two-component response regulator
MESDLILVVDDEESVCSVLASLFSREGLQTKAVTSAEEALSTLNGAKPGVALLDIKLPGMDGLDLLHELKTISPDTEVILMTGAASLDTAVEAIRNGAYDYLQKPFESLNVVLSSVRRAFEKRSLSQKNRDLILDLENSNRNLSAAVRRQKSLIEAGRAMGGITSLLDLLDFFVGVVSYELEVDRVSLMMLDEAKEEMWIVSSRGLDEDIVKKTRLKLGEGIAGKVAKEGKPILVKDVSTDPRIKASFHDTNFSSFISAPIVLSIPILLQEKVLGVINVTNRRTGLPFHEEDMAFLYSLAGQAAVVIEHTRRMEELQIAYESLKVAQNNLAESERFKALGFLAAGIAHEVKNPLAGILGIAQLARRGADQGSPLQKDLAIIEKEARRCKTIIENLMKFARQEQVSFQPVMIDKLIEETKVLLDHQLGNHQLRLETELDSDLPPVRGNANQLQQVLMNLIINAQQAMEGQRGAIKVSSSLSSPDAIEIRVSDTGPGIPKETQPKLFEPFFTTKSAGKGTGLGLSVTYGIVRDHQGEIRVESEPGEGAVFIIRLPVAEREDATVSETVPP